MCEKTAAAVDFIKRSSMSEAEKLIWITTLEKNAKFEKKQNELVDLILKLVSENKNQNDTMQVFRENCKISFGKHDENKSVGAKNRADIDKLLDIIPMMQDQIMRTRKLEGSVSFFKGAVWALGGLFISSVAVIGLILNIKGVI